MFFLFTKIEKINLKPLKRKNTFTFLNFPHFLKDSRNVLRSVNDCSVKTNLRDTFKQRYSLKMEEISKFHDFVALLTIFDAI